MKRASPCLGHEYIGWQVFVQHLAGGFRTGNRKHSCIEDADLF